MPGKHRRISRQKDQTAHYLSGDAENDRLDAPQRYTEKSSGSQQRKIEQTALLRAANDAAAGQIEALPIGQVTLVYSLFSDVQCGTKTYLCVVRKTLNKLGSTAVIVGDLVRFRDIGDTDPSGRPQGVIEQVLPRKTILTRSDSFKAMEQHPIVANADQMLIVASLHEPDVRWGLVDRMIIAAQSGGLRPIVCLNKIDLKKPVANDELSFAQQALAHYQSLGITTLQTSATSGQDIESLRDLLRDRTTVLAGHSGVGKSSLIRALQPTLDLRIAAISGYTGKGRHTTTSTRRYLLDIGGYVIDTPGVKLFGLWNLSRKNLATYFPDIENQSAPQWRLESYQRILDSLPNES
jgi:ribosome biogenesis GTPase